MPFQFPPDPYVRGGATNPQWLDAYSTLHRTTAAYGPFDGVYLAGQGILYTLRIPENVETVLDPPARAIGLADTCRKCHETVSKGIVEAASGVQPALGLGSHAANCSGSRPRRNPPGPHASAANRSASPVLSRN